MTTWPGTPDLSLVDLLVVLLPRSRAEAMTIDRLAQQAHASRRDVEQALQDMADSGRYPVCASSRPPMGVWWGTQAEVREYLERLDSRLRSQLRRRHGLRRWLTRDDRPLVMPWAEEAA
jgi:hypothetical protein